MNPCEKFTLSALSPVKATEDMTHPVGQRDGQLFTAPTGGLPEFNPETMEGWGPQIVDGAVAWTPNIKTVTADVITLKAKQTVTDRKVDEILVGITALAELQEQILTGEVD
jgi:hypothetical protein